MPATVSLLSCIALAAASLLVSTAFFRRRRRAEQERMTAALKSLQAKIDAALREDQGLECRRDHFRATLKSASLTTELQRPRLENMARLQKKPPEKYKIISQLAAQGMEIEEIAALLSISPVEAGQLLSLCTVARLAR